MANQAELNRAYYAGKQTYWRGQVAANPYAKGTALAVSWSQGVRDARGEDRLDNDWEWDAELAA